LNSDEEEEEGSLHEEEKLTIRGRSFNLSLNPEKLFQFWIDLACFGVQLHRSGMFGVQLHGLQTLIPKIHQTQIEQQMKMKKFVKNWRNLARSNFSRLWHKM